MTILVTGAAGFIGKHLTSALPVHDLGVAALDIKPLLDSKLVRLQGDICDAEFMAQVASGELGTLFRPTACVHLAAIASPPIAAKNPALAWATNVHGTYNVLELCRRIGCKRVIFMSSAHCVGIPPRYLPTNEEAPVNMVDCYTVTKLLGEYLCERFFQQHGLSYCTLRLWNAYGEGQSQDYFLGKKLAQAAAGHLTIRNADVTKDFIHVTDVVRAIMLAMESDYVGPLHIGTGVETHLADVVATIGEAFGLTPVDEQVPPEGPSRMACDWSRAKSILDWSPQVAFKDGLAELIELIRRVAA